MKYIPINVENKAVEVVIHSRMKLELIMYITDRGRMNATNVTIAVSKVTSFK